MSKDFVNIFGKTPEDAELQALVYVQSILQQADLTCRDIGLPDVHFENQIDEAHDVDFETANARHS